MLKEIKTLKQARAYIEELEARPVRDRGPKSQRTMTAQDAKEIQVGKLKDKSHKECAKALGLSYGQIYSARNGFTFKVEYKEAQKKK